MNDTEILSDDDVAMVVDQIIDLDKIDNANNYNRNSKQIETIVIDDETISQSNHNIETNSRKDILLDMDSFYRKNKLLAEFIEKCLNLEHSEGMLRVINRSLLRVYKETDEKYKNSPEFQKVLKKELRCIELEPHLKFTHMTNIIDALKSGGVKKRVRLTTVATNLKNNNNTKIAQRNKKNKRVADFRPGKVKRSKNYEIIDLDSDPNDVINLDEDQNDVLVLDEPDRIEAEKENNRDVNKTDDNNHEYTKNRQIDSEESSFLTPQIEVVDSYHPTEQESMIAEPVQRQNDRNGQSDVPMTIDITEEEESRNVEIKIRKIENQIENYKKIVQQLDEAEVTNDTMASPYILSEKVKAKIVSLYRTLCELIGSDSNKKRTVRLTVQDGHPAGPVKRLEEFINSKVADNGDPLFPDFRDVTMCVLEANNADGLGWNKGQILKEAAALFTQCGRALQRRRQKREWKDLLATVKTETLEYDPADEDPVLGAKLEQNRRVALCREHELLDRYSRMQDVSAQAKLNKVNLLPVHFTQNGRIIDSCESMNVRNEANYVINDRNVTLQNKGNNVINYVNIQREADITIEVPIESKEIHENIATNHSGVANNISSLVIIKTEVSVEFEPPENYVQVTEKSKESLHLDEKSTNDIPCSQIIRMEEDIAFETDINESNIQIKTESVHLEDANNTNHIACSQRLQMEEDSPSKKNKRKPDVENSEANSLDVVVKVKKEPVDINESNIQIKTESVHLEDANNTNHIACSQRLQMEEDSPSKKNKRKPDVENSEANSLDVVVKVKKEPVDINESNIQIKTESVHLEDANNTNNIPCSQRLQMEEDSPYKKDKRKPNVENAEANSLDVAVKVKKEPVDIMALLDGLGDNYSADIVDIEDPSLVIEILDSSDEE